MDKETGKAQVLVVDDEKSIRVTLREFLEDEGFMVSIAEGYDQALGILESGDFEVAVIDRILSNGHSGIEIIDHIRTAKPLCQTILITAYPTFESAKLSLRSGSCDYLVKPVARDEICKAVKSAAQTSLTKRNEKAACGLSQN